MTSAVSQQASPARSARGEVRRQAFLAAAYDVFIEQGYEAASVNDVVRIAGGSLATLYAQFGSKEGLFLAMCEARTQQFMHKLREITAKHEPLEQGLRRIGEHYGNTIFDRAHVAFLRILVAHPSIYKRYQELAVEPVRAVLRDYLEERKALGEVRELDCEWTAHYFIEMLRARHQLAVFADPDHVVTREECAEHVARAIDLVVNGMRPR